MQLIIFYLLRTKDIKAEAIKDFGNLRYPCPSDLHSAANNLDEKDIWN
jgi:hypothetical protein